MPTNSQLRMEREQAILLTLKKLGIASRSQIQKLHSLGTNRNASRVLKQMGPYLNSFQDTEMIYYLNKNGRLSIGADKIVTKSSQYKHMLMKNDIYIHFHSPKAWQDEFPINTPEVSFVADAVFLSGKQHYFLEVDHKQKMTANHHKLNNYFRFMNTGLWQKKNSGTFPILLFYTLSETRKAQLQEMNPGLDLQVYTTKDLY